MCVTCGKAIDVEYGMGHVLLNSDGDFACSSRCADTYQRKMNWIGGVVAQSEGATLGYLRGDFDFSESACKAD
jgi:hypothetical protein